MVKIDPNGTITLKLVLPWTDIQAAYQKHLRRHAQTIEIKGFRKGKAPLDTVAQTVGKAHIYQDAFAESFSAAYTQVITKKGLKPLITPQVKGLKTDEGADWHIEATTAQAPQFTLGDYKQYLKGKTKLESVFDALLQHIQFSVSPLLIDQAKNQALVRLLDQVNRLGLTIDQYLNSKQLTKEQLQAEYAQTATTQLRLEFILQEIGADLKLNRKQTIDALTKL